MALNESLEEEENYLKPYSEETFEVKSLLDQRVNPRTNKKEYLVVWARWQEENTWEPVQNLKEYSHLIKQYEDEKKSKKLAKQAQQLQSAALKKSINLKSEKIVEEIKQEQLSVSSHVKSRQEAQQLRRLREKTEKKSNMEQRNPSKNKLQETKYNNAKDKQIKTKKQVKQQNSFFEDENDNEEEEELDDDDFDEDDHQEDSDIDGEYNPATTLIEQEGVDTEIENQRNDLTASINASTTSSYVEVGEKSTENFEDEIEKFKREFAEKYPAPPAIMLSNQQQQQLQLFSQKGVLLAPVNFSSIPIPADIQRKDRIDIENELTNQGIMNVKNMSNATITTDAIDMEDSRTMKSFSKESTSSEQQQQLLPKQQKRTARRSKHSGEVNLGEFLVDDIEQIISTVTSEYTIKWKHQPLLEVQPEPQAITFTQVKSISPDSLISELSEHYLMSTARNSMHNVNKVE